MPEEAYASSSWDRDLDPNEASFNDSNNFPPNLSLTPPTADYTPPTNLLPSPPRSSSESAGRTPSKWRESQGQTTLERRDTITTITTNPETLNLVEPNFDENVLRMLCDLDVSGFPRAGEVGDCRNSTQCFRLITVFRPAATGQNQTKHCVVQGAPFDRSPLLLGANRFCRRLRFSSRRGPCWRTSMVGTCRNSLARHLSCTR